MTAFTASVLLTAAPAHALDFTFSFKDTGGGTNQFVTGTLSGLVDGNNTGTGITATVTSSPGGGGVGSGYNFVESANGNAFTVSGGNITFADVFFQDSSSNQLFLGTPSNNGGFNDELENSSGTFNYYDVPNNSTTQFTAASIPFELNSTVGIATLGICFGAAKLRRKYLAKKFAVSQDKGLVEV